MKFLRLLKYAFLLLVALALVLMSTANWDAVTLELIPTELSQWLGVHYAVELPLFIVVLVSIAVGLMVGFVWEWLREHRHRAEAKTHKRAAKQLEREVQSLQSKENEGKDEILALVDGSGSAR